ncbi:hypothetical protein Aperf_G00000051094 [Anoplocephala perfoliata]
MKANEIINSSKTKDSISSISKENPTVNTFKSRIAVFFFHYRLLLWKTVILRIRQPWVVLAELLLPLILVIVAVILRFVQMPQTCPPCHIVSQPLPSMGFLSYMRGVVCTFNSTCNPHDVDYQSRANIVPSWLSYFEQYDANSLEGLPSLMDKLSMADNPKSNSTDWRALNDVFCHDSTRALISPMLSSIENAKLTTYCSLPSDIQSYFFPEFIGTVAAAAESLIPKDVDSMTLDSSSPKGTDSSNFEATVLNISRLVCGNEPGSNSFINFFVAIRKLVGDDILQKGLDNVTQANETTCSILNSLFNFEATRPWTLRFRNVLQGEVFYHPVSPVTNEIMKRSNNTAIMLEKLKTISQEWYSSMDPLIPELVQNSPLFNQIRTVARICSDFPGVSQDVKDRCRRLLNFFETNSTEGYTHYTELLPMVRNISKIVNDVLTGCVVYDRFHGFSDETSMYEMYREATKANRTVTIANFQQTGKVLSVEFRLDPVDIDTTYMFKVMDKRWMPEARYETRDSMKYFTSGFIDLQDQIERAYISMTTGSKPPEDPYEEDFLPSEMQFIPSPCYRSDQLLILFVSNLPLMVMAMWLCNYVINVRVIVYEKEIRLKEFTKVMGMSNTVHWLNWFTVGFVMMTASSILSTIFLKCFQIYPKTDFFLLLCCFIAYILAILPQAFMISVFFTNASLSAVFSGVFYFVMYIPYNLILIYDLGFAPLLVLSLSPQCLIAMLFSRLMTTEVQGFGGQWNTLWKNDLSNVSFPLGLCMLMLLVDGILAWIAVWYLENVVPTSYGLIRKWYFPFTKSYWREVLLGRLSGPKTVKPLEPSSEDFDLAFHEPPDNELNVGVSVRGLTKCFGRKKVVAVNNMWVDFYENQITAFLGHNGAGKTTTINILTGIYAPTAGTAYVYGQDINYKMSEIRQHLGLCPQHNVLFDNLNVVEHIKFYGYLKGLSKEEVNSEINHFLDKLGLKQKAKELAKNLSGGQKRRLSLAAAFVGGSKIVFLDEPTAGVDPSSRRSIWNLIFNFKSARTIILTTHHMDEADVLGDRIAIVSQGRIKASGSSLFLKSKFAKFYYLSIEKSDSVVNNDATDSHLSQIISSQLAGAELFSSTPTEWVFTLPAHKAYDADGFIKLFTYLESNKIKLVKKFGMKGIGLSDTSLEEIFLLLSDDPSKIKAVNPVTQKKLAFIRKFFKRHHREKLTLESFNNSSSTSSTNDVALEFDSESDEDVKSSAEVEQPHVQFPTEAYNAKRNTGVALYLQQAYAYLAKRKQCVLRSKRGWVLEVVIPAITVIIMMLVLASYPIDYSQPSMPLHPWLMSMKMNVPHLSTFFANTPVNNTKASQISYKYSNEIASPRGWSGTRCLPQSLYKFFPAKYAYCNLKDYTVPNPLPALSPEGLKKLEAAEKISCTCDNGDFSCPSNAIVDPPRLLLPTTDYLMNLTNYNVSDYLIRSRNEAILKRYGGLMFLETKNGISVVLAKNVLSNQTLTESFLNRTFNNTNATQIGKDVADFVLNSLPPTQYARIWYNNKGWPSSVAYLNVLHNLQLRMLLGKNKSVSDPENHGIAIANYPMPSASATDDLTMIVSMLLELMKAVGIVVALSFTSASFSTFIIRERQCGSLAMQFLAGQKRIVYWTMSYIWDCTSLLVPIIIIVIVFIIFNETAYVSREHIGGFIALMFVYGLVITPLMYCLTFAFNSPSVAFVALLAINILTSIITSTIVSMLEMISFTNSGVKTAFDVLEKVFLIFPQYTLSRGFYILARHKIMSEITWGELLGNTDIWAWEGLTEKIVVMLVEMVIFFGVVLLISYTSGSAVCDKCLQKSRKKREKAMERKADGGQPEAINEDVLEEVERVKKDPLNAMHDVVRVFNLTKFYPKKKTPAVSNLTFGVRSGECFGLLGVNGAGKTTTFSMLTTTIHPTSGTIQIGDCDITENSEMTSHNLIGYCPQFDALLTTLTGFETLQLFARIHGYPEKVIPSLANYLIDRLSLQPHAHRPAHTYSGGNLRKLSTAVATVGQPQVLLLDEPTAGMDPGAKRCLWEVIKSLQQEGCSVVLTSHSMEECEVLCNRLAIMMDGQFQCFGTVAHLKQRFGEGYIIEVDLSYEEPHPQTLFPSNSKITMKEVVGKKCNFEARGEVKLSSIFHRLLALHDAGKIDAFAVRQASLDSVFVNFVRYYERENGEDSELSEEENEEKHAVLHMSFDDS